MAKSDYGLDLGDNLKSPEYWRSDPMKQYRRFMSGILRSRGRDSYQSMLGRRFDELGRQQQVMTNMGRHAYRSALGVNNPGALLSSAAMRASIGAPYGRARFDADEERRRQMYAAGNAFTQAKLAQNRMWTSVFNANAYRNVGGAGSGGDDILSGLSLL